LAFFELIVSISDDFFKNIFKILNFVSIFFFHFYSLKKNTDFLNSHFSML